MNKSESNLKFDSSLSLPLSHQNDDTDIELGIGEWNNKLERSIQSLGELSLGYKWMHCEMAKSYTTVYNRLMYASIALGPIVGVVNTFNQTFGDTTVIPLMITILSFLTGVLTGIIKFSDYEEKINNHKTAAAKYTSLANNARIQLNLEKQDRENPKQYIVWYTTSYGNLFESSPILSDNVMILWKKHAQRHGFKIPGEVGILMNADDSDNVKQEIDELKTQLKLKTDTINSFKNNSNLFGSTELTEPKSTDSFRLMMYSLGSQHETDFKTCDLAKFNKLLMKRKINEQEKILTSRNITPRQTPLVTPKNHSHGSDPNPDPDSDPNPDPNPDPDPDPDPLDSWRDNLP